jgi:dimethylargininase
LKSGIAWLGDGKLLVAEELAERDEFRDYSLLPVTPDEAYAANCIRVNDSLLVPAGYSRVEQSLIALGLSVIALEMSEFRKMDGGLSCLSLRF